MDQYAGEQGVNAIGNLSNIPSGVTLADMANPALTIQLLRARIAELEAALKGALKIADGSCADFTWQAEEELRELNAILEKR